MIGWSLSTFGLMQVPIWMIYAFYSKRELGIVKVCHQYLSLKIQYIKLWFTGCDNGLQTQRILASDSPVWLPGVEMLQRHETTKARKKDCFKSYTVHLRVTGKRSGTLIPKNRTRHIRLTKFSRTFCLYMRCKYFFKRVQSDFVEKLTYIFTFFVFLPLLLT